MLSWLSLSITLDLLQTVKQWHVEHAADHPIELQLWDAVLASWLMGWIGWLPTWVLDAWWAAPPLLLGMMAPRLYIGWRAKAHASRRIRCDWIGLVR